MKFKAYSLSKDLWKTWEPYTIFSIPYTTYIYIYTYIYHRLYTPYRAHGLDPSKDHGCNTPGLCERAPETAGAPQGSV